MPSTFYSYFGTYFQGAIVKWINTPAAGVVGSTTLLNFEIDLLWYNSLFGSQNGYTPGTFFISGSTVSQSYYGAVFMTFADPYESEVDTVNWDGGLARLMFVVDRSVTPNTIVVRYVDVANLLTAGAEIDSFTT